MNATAYIEVERPQGWIGGTFKDSDDPDYIEVTVEGSGSISRSCVLIGRPLTNLE